MKQAHRLAVIATSVSCALLTPAASRACGGCFGPPSFSATTTVTGHRMAFAVSDERTVLWDSFEYSGAPEEFSWVLPVLPGAYLEESTDAWFETLEAGTKTNVTSPALNCASPGGGDLGCGSAASSDASYASGSGYDSGNGVQVLHQGTVGPYETVTLRSTNGDALTSWLTTHDYTIPTDIQPVIDDYTAQGDDFIALRLQPGLAVQNMSPVRVITPGGEYLLPLRMVAAGVAEHVKIVLYVIGQQRYAMPDLHEVAVDFDKLTWTFSDNSNNYAELRKQALAKNLGFSYLPTYAREGGFWKDLEGPNGFPSSVTVTSKTNLPVSFSNIADLYFGQANSNDGKSPNSCGEFASILENGTTLVTADGSAGTIAKSKLECGKYTDLSAAMLGMRPVNAWLTRLELDLPKEALSMDCTVVPAESQGAISNQVRATHSKDRPSGCEEIVFESKLARGIPGRGSVVFALLFGGLLWLRRRGAAS